VLPEHGRKNAHVGVVRDPESPRRIPDPGPCGKKERVFFLPANRFTDSGEIAFRKIENKPFP